MFCALLKREASAKGSHSRSNPFSGRSHGIFELAQLVQLGSLALCTGSTSKPVPLPAMFTHHSTREDRIKRSDHPVPTSTRCKGLLEALARPLPSSPRPRRNRWSSTHSSEQIATRNKGIDSLTQAKVIFLTRL